MVDEEWRERPFAPSLPPIHSRLHTQRAQRNTPVGNHTGTHASRRTLPQPRGRQITRAQFTRMLGKFNIYSSNSPTPKGVWEICLRGTHTPLMPVCRGTIWKQLRNLVGSISVTKIAYKRLGTQAAQPPSRGSVAKQCMGTPLIGTHSK
jgi:hypothetical protein